MSDQQRQRLQSELDHLESRRRQLVEQRLSVSSLGGDDFGGGLRSEQWRDLDRKIDTGCGLGKIEARIAELQRLLSET